MIKMRFIYLFVFFFIIFYFIYKFFIPKNKDKSAKNSSKFCKNLEKKYQISNMECNTRYKPPVRSFLCKLFKYFLGKECKSYLEKQLIYEKDLYDLENNGDIYNQESIDNSKIKSKYIGNFDLSINNINLDEFGFKVNV